MHFHYYLWLDILCGPTTVNRYHPRDSNENIFLMTLFNNATVLRCGVSLVTILLLNFILFHWIRWIQWKSFRKTQLTMQNYFWNYFVWLPKFIFSKTIKKCKTKYEIAWIFWAFDRVQTCGFRSTLHFHRTFLISGCDVVKPYQSKRLLATATTVLNITTVTSEDKCLLSCFNGNPGCLAVNVITTGEVITCEMTTGLSNETDMADDSTSVLYVVGKRIHKYFHIAILKKKIFDKKWKVWSCVWIDYNKCLEEPAFCQNGGTCQQIWTSARCHCPAGYYGNTCGKYNRVRTTFIQLLLHFLLSSMFTSLLFTKMTQLKIRGQKNVQNTLVHKVNNNTEWMK